MTSTSARGAPGVPKFDRRDGATGNIHVDCRNTLRVNVSVPNTRKTNEY